MLVQLKKEERGEGGKLLKAISTTEIMSIYIFNKESKEQDKEIIPKVSVYKEKEWCKGKQYFFYCGVLINENNFRKLLITKSTCILKFQCLSIIFNELYSPFTSLNYHIYF